jgi:hypothetical protein
MTKGYLVLKVLLKCPRVIVRPEMLSLIAVAPEPRANRLTVKTAALATVGGAEKGVKGALDRGY